jgi:hypothetical protein
VTAAIALMIPHRRRGRIPLRGIAAASVLTAWVILGACDRQQNSNLYPHGRAEGSDSNRTLDYSSVGTVPPLYVVDTSSGVVLPWRSSEGGTGGDAGVALLAGGTVVVSSASDAMLKLFGRNGAAVSVPRIQSDDTVSSNRLSVFAVSRSSIALVDYDRRDLEYYNLSSPAGAPRTVTFEHSMGARASFMALGSFEDGSLFGIVGQGIDMISDRLYRRVYDLVRVHTDGSVSTILTSVRGGEELVPVPLGTDSGTLRRLSYRYPARVTYGQLLTATRNRIFMLSSNERLEVRSVDGRLVASVALPDWPDGLDARSDSGFVGEQVIPLALIPDHDGNVWLERPRAARVDPSEWWVIAPNGALLGAVSLPGRCRLRAAGSKGVVCETRAPGPAQLLFLPVRQLR